MSKTNIRGTIIYGVVALSFGLLCFVFYHPFVPVVMDDATSCQGLRISYLDYIKLNDSFTGQQTQLSGPIDGNKWIMGQPVHCSQDQLRSIKLMLHEPWVYGRAHFSGSRFDPQFAYRLSGPSGQLLILIDTPNDWFAVRKLDRSGKLVSNIDLAESNGVWTSQLKESFPNDLRTIEGHRWW